MFSQILFIYIIKQYIKFIFYITLVFAFLIIINTTISTIINFGIDIPYSILGILIFFPVPNVILQISPIIFVFATILTFIHFNRTQESTVIFSFTLSPGFFVFPMVLTIVLFGLFYLFIANPIAVQLDKKYVQYKNFKPNHPMSVVNVFIESAWIFDQSTKQHYIIYAKNITNNLNFHDVYFFNSLFKKKYMQLYFAKSAHLISKKYWQLDHVIEIDYKSLSYKTKAHLQLPTQLNTKILLNTLKELDSLSLTNLIERLKESKKIGTNPNLLWVKIFSLSSNAFLSIPMALLTALFLIYLPNRKTAVIKIMMTIILSLAFYIVLQIIESWFEGHPSKLVVVVVLFPSLLSIILYYLLFFKKMA